MTASSFPTFLRVALAIGFAAEIASACLCNSGIQGKTPRETAQKRLDSAAAVFEGTPVHFELQWDLLAAKSGDLVPVRRDSDEEGAGRRMLVTFQIQRAYKGVSGREVQIATRLGGGDCGAIFNPGLSYLVYARGSGPPDLSVTMCSPGGWISDIILAPDLRYLRKERPIASDLAINQREIEFPSPRSDNQRRYDAATGAICGTVLGASGTVSFLSTLGYSPTGHSTAQVKPDGSFCAERLGPGKYYLYFTGASGPNHPAAAFYPGVSNQAKATAVEVRAGQTQSGLTFKVPTETYSVQGFISTNDKAELGEDNVYVTLLGPTFRAWYNQSVDFRGVFPLPKMKRFKFERVPPGHYVAYATASTRSGHWFTRKLDIDVTANTSFIFLELVHKK